MKFSILVPTLGTRLRETRRLFDSLKQQTYKDLEIVIVTQDNHEDIFDLISEVTDLDIKQIRLDKRGISVARNAGLKEAKGDIVVLYDDDCWYPEDAMGNMNKILSENPRIKVLLTQIEDPEKGLLYKEYPCNRSFITNKIQLLRKSSIEIAFRRGSVSIENFDERLGIGAEFCNGEEVDFLINNFEKETYYYEPVVTVYHLKKFGKDSKEQVKSKGALYGKHFNLFICLSVLIRDLLFKRENNFKAFFIGYFQYKRG